MNGRRVSVSIPGADAGVLTRAAGLADRSNIDVWLGDPRGGAPNSDDSYVTAAAAAAAAVTAHCRIGVFLSLRSSGSALRVAEDIGVVDQASGGRLELGLVVPADGRAEWEIDAQALLAAWNEWPLPDGRAVAALPGPAQPWLPRLVIGDGPGAAERLGAGVLHFEDGTGPLVDSHQRRIALGVDLHGSVRTWLEGDPLGAMLDLRARADASHAHDVVIVLRDYAPDRLDDDMRLLGVVVGTSLRCPEHKVEFLALDAWRWLHELTHLHDQLRATAGRP
jgi:hypothetical protein